MIVQLKPSVNTQFTQLARPSARTTSDVGIARVAPNIKWHFKPIEISKRTIWTLPDDENALFDLICTLSEVVLSMILIQATLSRK